jgi:hypothetical protein
MNMKFLPLESEKAQSRAFQNVGGSGVEPESAVADMNPS